jgi:hypothetical protein
VLLPEEVVAVFPYFDDLDGAEEEPLPEDFDEEVLP